MEKEDLPSWTASPSSGTRSISPRGVTSLGPSFCANHRRPTYPRVLISSRKTACTTFLLQMAGQGTCIKSGSLEVLLQWVLMRRVPIARSSLTIKTRQFGRRDIWMSYKMNQADGGESCWQRGLRQIRRVSCWKVILEGRLSWSRWSGRKADGLW